MKESVTQSRKDHGERNAVFEHRKEVLDHLSDGIHFVDKDTLHSCKIRGLRNHLFVQTISLNVRLVISAGNDFEKGHSQIYRYVGYQYLKSAIKHKDNIIEQNAIKSLYLGESNYLENFAGCRELPKKLQFGYNQLLWKECVL